MLRYIVIATIAVLSLSIASQHALAWWGGGSICEAPWYHGQCVNNQSPYYGYNQQPTLAPVWWGGGYGYGCHQWYNPCWGCNQGWSGGGYNNYNDNQQSQQQSQQTVIVIPGLSQLFGGNNGYP